MYLLTTKATPQPFLWEMALLGTIIPTLIGWTSLAKVCYKFFLLPTDSKFRIMLVE